MPDKQVFPAVLPESKVQGGLTLREYYAAMVIQGMIASGEEISTTRKAHGHRNEKLAQRAVEVADALIVQLDRKV